MPTKKISLAAVVGGLTLFLWGAISHMALPLYDTSLHKFTNQDAVSQAIVANAPHSGTYFLPNYPNVPAGASAEEKKALNEKMEMQMANGPMMFAHIRVGPSGNFGAYLAIELLKDILSTLVVGLLLLNARQMSLRGRVFFVVGIAVAIVFESSISSWNWYSAGTDYTITEISDEVIGWLLAGLVIAKLLPGTKQAAEAQA